MTWGCNASFVKLLCPWCGATMIDDRDDWPTSHMQICPLRSRLRRIRARLTGLWIWTDGIMSVTEAKAKLLKAVMVGREAMPNDGPFLDTKKEPDPRRSPAT